LYKIDDLFREIVLHAHSMDCCQSSRSGGRRSAPRDYDMTSRPNKREKSTVPPAFHKLLFAAAMHHPAPSVSISCTLLVKGLIVTAERRAQSLELGQAILHCVNLGLVVEVKGGFEGLLAETGRNHPEPQVLLVVGQDATAGRAGEAPGSGARGSSFSNHRACSVSKRCCSKACQALLLGNFVVRVELNEHEGAGVQNLRIS